MISEELLAHLLPLVGLVQRQVESQTVLNFARAAEILNKLNQSAALELNAPSRDACLARIRDVLSAPSASLSPEDPAKLEKALDGMSDFVNALNPPKAP
jgi:hypothetical protein